MHMVLNKITLCAVLLVFITMLSGHVVFADESSVVFGVS